MHHEQQNLEEEQWVIWNGSYGVADTVTIGRIEDGENGRNAWLDEPYDMVGPFSLDELESSGRISFAACHVMSRQKWQADQVGLRQQAHKKRREAEERLSEFNAQFNQGRREQPNQFQPINEKQHRVSLNLPVDGELKPAQIKAAYRRLAQKAHPDVGGSHEQFVQITKARDALLVRHS